MLYVLSTVVSPCPTVKKQTKGYLFGRRCTLHTDKCIIIIIIIISAFFVIERTGMAFRHLFF
jgi:hypothetical protein